MLSYPDMNQDWVVVLDFFIFTPTWRNDPLSLIFFKWVGSTTN